MDHGYVGYYPAQIPPYEHVAPAEISHCLSSGPCMEGYGHKGGRLWGPASLTCPDKHTAPISRIFEVLVPPLCPTQLYATGA
jgi:hypothetical protein